MDPIRKAFENGMGVMTVEILVIQPTSSPLSLQLSNDYSIPSTSEYTDVYVFIRHKIRKFFVSPQAQISGSSSGELTHTGQPLGTTPTLRQLITLSNPKMQVLQVDSPASRSEVMVSPVVRVLLTRFVASRKSIQKKSSEARK
jgi:hypothetical protein